MGLALLCATMHGKKQSEPEIHLEQVSWKKQGTVTCKYLDVFNKTKN